MQKQQQTQTQPVIKQCLFCVENVNTVDYQDTVTLKRFVSSYMKIAPRKRSGLCAGHQRKLANAIKHARVAGLMPFVSR